MTKLQNWLEKYKVCHKNPTNILIHKFCVPAILWSLLALLSLVTFPQFQGGFLHLASCLSVAGLIFYATLGLKPFAVMFILCALCLSSSYYWVNTWGQANLLIVSSSVFVLAWILQFIGHKIEGAKPAFFDDLFFLLIGPLWVFKRLL